jgi:membrane dipeptidase
MKMKVKIIRRGIVKIEQFDVIDLHCDTVYGLIDEKTKNGDLKTNNLCIDIDKLKLSNYMAQFFALFVDAKEHPKCYDRAKIMLQTLKTQVNKYNHYINFATNYNELIDNKNNNKISAFITIEEGGVLEGNLDYLKEFYSEGIRLVTLTWNYVNELGYPNYKWEFLNNGLLPRGKEFVEAMNELGIIIDVSHLSDGGFYDVLDISKKPFIASHSNARQVTNHSRNLTDEMIRKLSDKGGVMGINFCDDFLGDKNASIDSMIRHINHIYNVGGIECISLGTDFDGIENKVEIENAGQMQNLAFALHKEGYSTDKIEKIFSKNVIRLIKDVL